MADKKNPEEKARQQINDMEKDRANALVDILHYETQILKAVSKILEEKQDTLLTDEAIAEAQRLGRKLTDDEYDALVETHKKRKESLATIRDQTKEQKKYNAAVQVGLNSMVNGVKNVWQYLMDSDKAMKEMILDFGLTGGKAEMLRDAMEDSAVQAARLGVNVRDMTEMYKAYVAEVGRAVSLGDKQLIAMTQLAKGTGLANTEAAGLAGHFEMMGLDLENTVKTVEGIMETTERMGVNTTKVLKTVGENFKKLQTFTFQGGVKAMAELAAHSEKFKIDIGTALSSAEKFRKLDNVVEGAAQLQVLGGEFAKLADPMQMFYESRNDMNAFTDRIGKMTNGMATMVETTDGFQLELASPQARDMLEKAGDALGFSVEQMTEMAKQQYKMNTLRSEMMGSGYNEEQKEMIEGMSQLNSDTGKFYVMIGNKKRDLVDLSASELSLLEGQQKSLEERAKAAQTFDDQFKIFGDQLKSLALPLLQGINVVLGYIQKGMDKIAPLFEAITGSKDSWAEIAGVGVGITASILSIGVVLKLVTGAIGGIAGKIGGIFGGGKGGLLSSIGGKGGTAMMKNMAGLGVAAVGLGIGIKLAAEGISALADSFANLNEQQLDAVVETVQALGWTIVGVLVPAVITLGIAGKGAALGLLAFGAAALMVGGGIGIAAAGVGYMAEGFSKLLATANADNVTALAVSMGTFATAAAAVANPLSLIGLASMAASIAVIGSYGDDLLKVGDAFGNIGTVLKGTKGQFKEVEESIKAISNIDLSANASFAELANLLKQPLKVQFADQDVGFNVNVDLNIDKNKLIAALDLHQTVPVAIKDGNNGNAV